MLNSFSLKLSVCICTQSALITFKKICWLRVLLLSHLWILITYFLDSFLMSLKVNDLIADEEEKEENKEMNDSLFI